MGFNLLIYLVCILLTYLIKLQLATSPKNTTFAEKLLDRFQQTDYKLKFERAEGVRCNKQILKKCEFVAFKYNRTTAALNMTWTTNVNLHDNIDIVNQNYKFASNEYRLFPMRMQYNFCEAIDKNTLGLGSMKNCGNFTGCPILKNKEIFICNWTPDESKFPPFIPNGQYMVELQFVYHNVELSLVRAYVSVARPIV